MDELTLKRRAINGNNLIEPMLVVSTAHVTEDEAGRIDDGEFWVQPVFTREEGWVFHVGRDAAIHGVVGDLSEGFRLVVQRANLLGCTWLMFDRDAETVEDIPYCEW